MRGKPGEPLAWLIQHVEHKGDACVVWPFGKGSSGRYGAVFFDGRVRGAHRVMCELKHGKPPSPGHLAAHSCGNGRDGCVNPKHLRWATITENGEDRRRHLAAGVEGWPKPAKLSPEDVAAIRESKGVVAGKLAARMFGVSESLVSRIRAGHRRARACNPKRNR